MNKDLLAHIEYLLCIRIEAIRRVSGGDSSTAYLLTADSEMFFCKTNSGSHAFQLFKGEHMGLEAIAKTKTIAVPKVLLCEKTENGALLILEYIASKRPSVEDMALLGHQIAALHHLTSSQKFGRSTDNFIGNLAQSNKTHTNWATFYMQERLVPQLRMAQDSNLLSSTEIPSETHLFKICETLFFDIQPSLLHGDLWHGNVLISSNGTPYLIDPSVYYGHHEVDIAMTRLFGGFSASFYDAYAAHWQKTEGETERNNLYQLYYLLAHLNLFGSSYKASVTAILHSYF